MPPINTENFIAPAPRENGRSVADNFFTEKSADESFREHFRQAFRPAAEGTSSQRHQSDAASKSQHTERPESREQKHDKSAADYAVDGRADKPVVDNTSDSHNTDSKDGQRDTEELRDNRSSSGPGAIESSNTENQADDDQTQGNDVGSAETVQNQTIVDGAELVVQIVAADAELKQQEKELSQQNSEQQLSSPSSGQSLEVAADTATDDAGLEDALNQGNAAQATLPKSEAAVESGKIAELPKETAIENAAENSQDTQQAVTDADASAKPVNPGQTAMDAAADEADRNTVAAASTGEEAIAQDASAQSQVAADQKTAEKNRRDSDRIEANAASENAVDNTTKDGVQTAAVSPVANTTAGESNELDFAKNTVDKIAASDATDKDTGDTKAASSQPGQSEISAAQRTQSGQEARTAAASGTSGGEEIDSTDRVRFVQRVAKAIEGAGRDGGTLRMRLHPSELGSLRLEVTIRDGVLNARIETDTHAAKNILLDNLPALRDRLAQQDIKVQQFDIDYTGGNNNGSPQSSADQHQSNDRSAARHTGTQTRGETATEDTQAAPRARRLGGAAQLDFVA